MSSRRYHQKSRTGCIQCKKRRVKVRGLGYFLVTPPICVHNLKLIGCSAMKHVLCVEAANELKLHVAICTMIRPRLIVRQAAQ